ncbi:synaptic vesicle glycoprotein 2A-like [Arctopsyche grandis]|uniref:synaptic vesicle glycoprotein 2A-like n=1 Tax=Arctopsyche grandis TaxID=121162 RepID=UPI00406D9CF2
MDHDKFERADFETAIQHAGYGRYQARLLCVCGIIYATCAMSTTTLSFVLPSAECDFNLTSSDKGKLNATPLIGMVTGSYLWGSLADSRGRRAAILCALLLDAAAAIASSLATTFPIFLACRFFNGFGVIGATSLVFPYFGDFLSIKHRDVMLCRLEVFWTMGTILLPGLAWGVIPSPWWWFGKESAPVAPWRAFVGLCAAPPLLAAAALAFLPEAPRFLLTAGRKESALDVIKGMHTANKTHNTFMVTSLSRSNSEPGSPSVHLSTTGNDTVEINNDSSIVNKSTIISRLCLKLSSVVELSKTLFSPPYLKFIILTCFVDFGLMFSYYTLMMWFPDLFERFGHFSLMHPGKSAGVCEVTSIVTMEGENAVDKCNSPVNSEVFLHTLIVGVSCLPTSITVGLTINKLGKKFLLVFMLMTSGCAAVGLNWVHSSNQNLILSCIFEGIISCTEAVLFCVIVEIFPPHLGATAMSLTVTCGRIGAIVGNVIFGALIDMNCVIPIYTFGALLITSGLFCLALPKNERRRG